jgi:hypothetical protein
VRIVTGALRDARVALAGGLALVAIAVVIVLSGSPQVLTGTNAITPVNAPLASVPGGGSACQANETLPAGTTGIGLSLEATAGPRVAVTVRSGTTILTLGESAPGWLGQLVTIPVKPLNRTVGGVTVCFAFTGADERVSFLGAPTSGHLAARSPTGALPGRIAIEYLRAGPSSWWSLARSVARRMGLGRAWAGSGIVILIALLMAMGLGLASWLTIRESQ